LNGSVLVDIGCSLLKGHTVFGRVQRALRAETCQQVADALGAKLGTVKSWSARGHVPARWLIRCKRVSGRSLEWLLLGDDAAPEVSAQLAQVDALIDGWKEARDWFGPIFDAQHGHHSAKPLRP
jgi:hypothetical protein